MNLNELLKREDMSMRQLSIKSNVPYSTIRDLCTGVTNIENVTAKTLFSISKVLYVSMESLLNNTINTPLFKSSFTSKDNYYKEAIGKKTNVVLRSLSALDYYGYVTNGTPDKIMVYSIYKMPDGFDTIFLKNFSSIETSSFNGLLVSTLDQAINDILKDKNIINKTIKDIFNNIYFENSKILEELNIKKPNLPRFTKIYNLVLRQSK